MNTPDHIVAAYTGAVVVLIVTILALLDIFVITT